MATNINKLHAEATYRVGDYVYIETSTSSPFQIRRIEELNKTQSGVVEAKVMCFYRRRDLPSPLVQLADKHQMATAEDSDSPVAMKLKKMWLKTPVSEEQAAQAVLDPAIAALEEEQRSNSSSNGNGTEKSGENQLSTKQRHQMKHRELFLSRQVETLPATNIRGKCSVTLLNEEESLLSYLHKDDTFFYCLVFDPTQKTLLADKGEIRVGSRYQTELIPLLKDGESYDRKLEDLESLIWTPHHSLNDRKIDQFLVVSRSVGTFARALDCSSSVKQPSLHMSAAAASRDITLFHAMDTLHKHSYSVETAMCSLVPSSGPVLCRDEMEEWSASEANLFEEALDKYGKDFNDIRNDFLPWKTLKNIVEYYYMWKTTDRYVQQKRVKAVEAESKLKQVYIPNYPKPITAPVNNNNNNKTNNIPNGNSNGNANVNANSNANSNSNANVNSNSNANANANSNAINNVEPVQTMIIGKPCESCYSTVSMQWYFWGPQHLNCRLCQTCWNYWKKYGGLKIASRVVAENDVDALKKRPSVEFDPEEERLAHRQNHKCTIGNCGKEFKLKAHLMRHFAQAHGIAIRSGSPRPIMKTRSAFYLQTTVTTKVSRKLCRAMIKSKKAARQPSYSISLTAVKAEFAMAITKVTITDIRSFLKYKKKDRGSVTLIANRLGNPAATGNEWLILTPKDQMPIQDKPAFPKPPKAADGSLIYERIPNKVVEPEKFVIPNTIGCTIITPTNLATPPPSSTLMQSPIPPVSSVLPIAASAVSAITTPMTTTPISSPLPPSMKRRAYEMNGMDPAVAPPPAKRPNKDPMPSYRPSPEQYAAMIEAAAAAGQPLPRTHLNGKPKIAQMSRSGSGRKHVISWMDAPDDYYFRPTELNKKNRRSLSVIELRRLARKPWRKSSLLNTLTSMNNAPISAGDPQVVILD